MEASAPDSLQKRAKLRLPPLPQARQAAPSDSDVVMDNALREWMGVWCPPPDAAARVAQKAALARLCAIFQGWAHGTPVRTLVSGSYRLNVHGNDTDIDIVFVVPKAITRTQVFASFVPHLVGTPGVADVHPVPDARVPVIGVTVDGQEFDVLTCHAPTDGLPDRGVLLETYDWMNGMDEASVLAFNGPRVTELILHTVERFPAFQSALRFLRFWAKQRFVYSNKSGYYGGVNLALLVVWAAQRQPRAGGAALVQAVFDAFAKWPVGTAITLDAHVPHTCPAWLAHLDRPSTTRSSEASGAIALLTPCFPRYNTMHSASVVSAGILRKELHRAARSLTANPRAWSVVCAPLSTFALCRRFIRVEVRTPDTAPGRLWAGFMEAHVRTLDLYLHNEELAIADLRLVPAWVTLPTPDAVIDADEGPHALIRAVYMTADDDCKVRTYPIRGTLGRPLEHFLATFQDAGPDRPPGATMTISFCSRTAVPSRVLDCVKVLPEASGDVPTPSLAPDARTLTESAGTEDGGPPSAGILKRRRVAGEGEGGCCTGSGPCIPARKRFKLKTVVGPPPPLPTFRALGVVRDVLTVLHGGVSQPPAVRFPIVRPVPVVATPHRAAPVDTSWDVYIGGATRFRGVEFGSSVLSRPVCPDGTPMPLPEYRTFLLAECADNPSFMETVRSLYGRTLACWCTDQTQCHGVELILAAEAYVNAVVSASKRPH